MTLGRATPRTWTLDEVRALGTQTDLVTACAIAYGAGRTKAYELHRAGELHFPALKVGSRIVVPVAPLLHFVETGQRWERSP